MNIGIVGAGLSGLRTAQLLERSGHQVTLFEARNRLGGRVWSVKSDQGFYEAGGEWIDSDHHRMLRLLEELRIKAIESDQWPGRVAYKGEFAAENEPWPEAARDMERVSEHCSRLLKEFNSLSDGEMDKLNRRTLKSWLDEACLSEVGRWLAGATIRSDEGEDAENLSLLGWLQGQMLYEGREEGAMSQYRVENGAQNLCEKMAETLSGKICLNTPVRQVSLDSNSVSLSSDSGTAHFDRIVVTAPPKALLNIEWPSHAVNEKQAAWQSIGSTRTIKVAMTFASRFWQDSDWKGRLLCDAPFQQIWDGGQGGANILTVYICGEEAEEFLARQPSPDELTRELARFIPGIEPITKFEVIDWISDPWSLGGFSYLKPDNTLDMHEILSKVIERIHFAGESTARWHGFMEGALESAERAANELG